MPSGGPGPSAIAHSWAPQGWAIAFLSGAGRARRPAHLAWAVPGWPGVQGWCPGETAESPLRPTSALPVNPSRRCSSVTYVTGHEERNRQGAPGPTGGGWPRSKATGMVNLLRWPAQPARICEEPDRPVAWPRNASGGDTSRPRPWSAATLVSYLGLADRCGGPKALFPLR